jgi:hypothetical protein
MVVMVKNWWLAFGCLVVLVGGFAMAYPLNNDYAAPVREQVETVQADVLSGWWEDSRTWTFAADNDPEFTATVEADLTTTVQAGYKLRLKQNAGSYVYFFVTKLTYSAPNTTLTLYGGTDYNLANEPITDVAFSPAKSPYGFPMNPEKWTVKTETTSDFTQTPPVAGTWYNTGTSIDIPIGLWSVSYQVKAGATYSPTVEWDLSATLSTSNSSVSNTAYSHHDEGYVSITNGYYSRVMERNFFLSLSSETTYYLLLRSGASNPTNLYAFGSTIPTIIRAVCAYL